MAKQLVISEIPIATIISVTWPILGESKATIQHTVLSVLNLIRSQFNQGEQITIFQILMGNFELNGLTINYGTNNVSLNYFRDMPRNKLEIFFTIPKPGAAKALTK